MSIIYPNSFPGRIHKKLLMIITFGRNNCGLREEKLKFRVIPRSFSVLATCVYCIKKKMLTERLSSAQHFLIHHVSTLLPSPGEGVCRLLAPGPQVSDPAIGFVRQGS